MEGNQNFESTLDPKALKLMRAIRQKESGGNYGAVGDSGTSTGAFQFQGDTWRRYASEVLGNENAEPSRGNQNKVAYTKIKGWKDQGWTPEQIAAAWNAGEQKATDGTWRQNRGYNERIGMSYDTPKYVEEVMSIARGGGASSGTPSVPNAPQTVPTVQAETQDSAISQADPSSQGLLGGLFGRAGKAVGGFAKALIRPAATLVARPFQAAAASVGVPSQKIDEFSERRLGGLVAPVPQGASGVAKDIGRGLETVAMGIGLGAGAKGFQQATKQGVMSLAGKGAVQGAKSGAIGGAGVALEDSGTGVTAGDLAAKTIGGATLGAIGGGAAGGTAGILGKAKNAVLPSREAISASRSREISSLIEGNKRVRNAFEGLKHRGFVDDAIINSDLLSGAVNRDGTVIASKAIKNVASELEPYERVILDTVEKEGKMIPVKDIETHLLNKLKEGDVRLGGLKKARNEIADDIEGLLEEADANGMVPLSAIQRAKTYKYSNLNYDNPETKRAGKLIAQGFRELVENNVDSLDVKATNEGLAKMYELIEVLEALEGAKVKGGRLGKYFAQTFGGIVGSHFGPLGTILGAETAAGIKGLGMASRMAGRTGQQFAAPGILKEALEKSGGATRRVKVPVISEARPSSRTSFRR